MCCNEPRDLGEHYEQYMKLVEFAEAVRWTNGPRIASDKFRTISEVYTKARDSALSTSLSLLICMKSMKIAVADYKTHSSFHASSLCSQKQMVSAVPTLFVRREFLQ